MNNTTVQVDLHAPALWRDVVSREGVSVRLRGHVFAGGFADVANRMPASIDADALNTLSRETDGLFAVLVQDQTSIYAAVDRVGTAPLYYGWDGEQWHVSDGGGALARTLGLGTDDINRDGALAMAMAGYTIGGDTLYKTINVLKPGQSVVLGPGQAEQRMTYDRYAAWETEDQPYDALLDQLTEVTLGIMEKTVRSVGERTIVVPLSAGLDSRLVVSALRHLGHENVKCFSYGIPGNHEAIAAERIAKALGYPWRFVPYTPNLLRAFFASDDHEAYIRYADSCINVPFEQDLAAIRALQGDGYIPQDAVVINGNSGDFISGNHILAPFHTPRRDLEREQRRELIVDTLTNKHFRLWRALATPGNDALIKARLMRELDVPVDNAEDLAGIYEFLEFQDRQSKFVVSGQRVYEYAGLDWRLPLWDCAYLDFWRRAPLQAKVGQALYKDMLTRNDWGGVWQGTTWTVAQNIVPTWIRLPRLACKILHAPLGADAWHRFEKRFLGYWMEPLQGQAMHTYTHVAKDTRGARHMVAWHSEAYLRRHGIDWQGNVL